MNHAASGSTDTNPVCGASPGSRVTTSVVVVIAGGTALVLGVATSVVVVEVAATGEVVSEFDTAGLVVPVELLTIVVVA